MHTFLKNIFIRFILGLSIWNNLRFIVTLYRINVPNNHLFVFRGRELF